MQTVTKKATCSHLKGCGKEASSKNCYICNLLDEQQSITGRLLVVCTKLNYSLLSQCGINWIYMRVVQVKFK